LTWRSLIQSRASWGAGDVTVDLASPIWPKGAPPDPLLCSSVLDNESIAIQASFAEQTLFAGIG
jgi:hypothetical protein